MLKHLLATSALAATLFGAAIAQEADESSEPAMENEAAASEEQGATGAEEPAMAEEGQAAPEEPAATAQEGEPAADPLADPSAAEDPVAAEAEPQMTPVEISELTAEDLFDASVRNADGETLGSIDDALLGDDGKIEALVVSFGGFLGFGERTVELALDEVELMGDGAGTVVVETSLRPEDLESRPDYQAEPEA